jgi:hypothetical protein
VQRKDVRTDAVSELESGESAHQHTVSRVLLVIDVDGVTSRDNCKASVTADG